MKKIEENTTPPGTPSHYVGIGASAGGLEAIEAFVTNMPLQSNLAFIIIQHLSPDYKSLMVELLAKKTEMGVHRAEEGMVVLAGNIYLIPPKKILTIFHGKLLLKDKTPYDGTSLPIDIFLQSLAEDQGERAIAIILSGTGSDGARGVRAIKENNGMVLVQDEISAKFDGMPKAAITTGAADHILSPERMPDQLIAYLAHPYISGEKDAESLLEDADSLTRLFAELRAKTKVDFTHYKPTTISRRIERRMTVNQINDFDEYVRYLASFPGEVMALYREMLIGVTSFFRDPMAMNEIRETYLPDLFKSIKNREFRCWVAGCSTGEEAYTLAIMCKEFMEEHQLSCDVKIFATDIDRDAILKASMGIYSESIAADLPPNLLAKYFYHKEDSFQITRVVREMVVFAQHNLVNDPPFTNIDLISCRNLLIYLQPVLQVKALSMFNFSLNPHGILFLGKSETVGEMSEFFRPLNQRYKIYESLGKKLPLPEKLQVTGKKVIRGLNYNQGAKRPERRSSDREAYILKGFIDLAAKSYIPLAVIVNEQLDVQQIIGDTTGYFTIPSGPIEYNITKLAVHDLAIPLATGIQKVFRTEEEVTYSNIHLGNLPETKSIRLHIQPLPKKRGHENMVVAFFQEITATKPKIENDDIEYNYTKEAQQRIDDLEQELQFAKENLQATIEELETSNEELQATNEELLASNEELQSTNEELQSTNEELYTVNAEHQNKIIELTELTNDVDNLLTSSKIGTLIVDENLEIRKYSPEIKNIFNILEKDVGRPISHISHFLLNFDPVAEVAKVQQSNTLSEREVQTTGGVKYLTRIMPYHIGPEMYSGVVLTFVDISELDIIRQDLEQLKKTDRHIRDKIPAGFLIYRQEDNKLLLADCNPEAEKLTGISLKNWCDRELKDIWPQIQEERIFREFLKANETGTICSLDNISFSNDSNKGIFHIHAFWLPGQKLAISFENQSLHVHNNKNLNSFHQRFTNLLESAHIPWWDWKIQESVVIISKEFAAIVGVGAGQEIDSRDFWSNVIHPDDLNHVLNERENHVSKNGGKYEISYRLRTKSGKFVDFLEQGEISGWSEDLNAQRFIGVLSNVSQEHTDS